ncbi:hypothetical protein ACLKZ7_02345 [Shewanella algae]|uniref:hypothetical protein n=1 Tax=Shewanella algae TaxID=38313 RepID=UPI001AAD1591|nr:hypothetical protein [Shewanella algae]MBO2552369.1 hypothetical protein [Shewanella algae]
MLHLEIAVAPEQVRTLADLNLLEARIGFDKGAVLSRFPAKWYAQVAQHLAGQDGHVDRITEKLKRIKESRLVGFGRAFDGDSWGAAAQRSHQVQPFHRVVDGVSNERPHFINDLQLMDDVDFQYQTQYPRDAQSLAKAARALLTDAEKVTVFDNYICPTKPGCVQTLTQMMQSCTKTEVEFHVFAKEDENKPRRSEREQALDDLKAHIPAHVKLYWYWLDDNGSGHLHQRGIFTAKGGLIYDRGFEEPNNHLQRAVLTNITPMPQTMLETKARDFNPAQLSPPLALVGMPWQSHP